MVKNAFSSARAAIAVTTFVICACTPSFDDHSEIIGSPQLIAITASPPEGAPSATFSLSALYVGPSGPIDAPDLDWAICIAPKPLSEPGPIAEECFVDASPNLIPLGRGVSVSGAILANACQLFGPDPPSPPDGQPSARPVDADTTGGYFLPVRVKTSDGSYAAALERITCPPSDVTADVSTSFTKGYIANANPSVASITRDDGTAIGGALTVARGERVAFTTSWPTCDPTAPGTSACGGAETYLYVDPDSHELLTQRESIAVSYFATGGALDVARNGRDEQDLATSVDNAWTAPDGGGNFFLWIVLRDARGGVGVTSIAITVSP